MIAGGAILICTWTWSWNAFLNLLKIMLPMIWKKYAFFMQIFIRQHMGETAGINIILFSSVFRWISAIKSSTAKWPPLHQAIQDYMSRPSEETRMWTRPITGQSGVSQQAQLCSNHSMRISSFSLKIRSVNIVTNNNLSYLTVT